MADEEALRPRSLEYAVDTGMTCCGVSILRPAETVDRHVGVLYLHGGGLLYGTRDDLPKPYVDLMLGRGLTLVCADYPLAPQVGIEGINAAVRRVWEWYVDGPAEELGLSRHLLCGRSAGAYLALKLADALRMDDEPTVPLGILDFYGYCDLAGDVSHALWEPSTHYARMPRVSKVLATSVMGDEPITSAPLAERYSLYVYARQTGTWGRLIGLDKDHVRACSVDVAAQALLPPTFIAASTADQDVPFSCSKRLSRTIPDARMFTAYYLEHDFDRDLTRPEGMQAWTACMEWVDGLL